jgi:hypothetical protein
MWFSVTIMAYSKASSRSLIILIISKSWLRRQHRLRSDGIAWDSLDCERRARKSMHFCNSLITSVSLERFRLCLVHWLNSNSLSIAWSRKSIKKSSPSSWHMWLKLFLIFNATGCAHSSQYVFDRVVIFPTHGWIEHCTQATSFDITDFDDGLKVASRDPRHDNCRFIDRLILDAIHGFFGMDIALHLFRRQIDKENVLS